jgi:hypothetical protein
MRKTKPICAAEPGGTSPRRHGTRGKCAKQTQFLGKSGGDAQPTKRRLCETKPNLVGLGYLGKGRSSYVGRLRRKVECAKRTQFAPAGRNLRVGQVRQTNPICRRWAGKTIVKAKGLGDATRHQGNCAKQDTRDKSLVQPDRPAISARKRGAKPNSATFVVGIKQSQFCGRARKWAWAGAFRCQSCQTKPIGSPWRPYKQSQFAAGTCRARACPELAEGTPDPRSGRGQAPRRVEGDRAKQSQFRSTAGETLRLQVSGQDLQCWQRLGIALVRTSHGEREL